MGYISEAALRPGARFVAVLTAVLAVAAATAVLADDAQAIYCDVEYRSCASDDGGGDEGGGGAPIVTRTPEELQSMGYQCVLSSTGRGWCERLGDHWTCVRVTEWFGFVVRWECRDE
jgi:hypothetical protein